MLPIHVAAMNGYLDCFKRFMSVMNDFYVDTTDDLGRTCLHVAACGGCVYNIADDAKYRKTY